MAVCSLLVVRLEAAEGTLTVGVSVGRLDVQSVTTCREVGSLFTKTMSETCPK